MNESALMCSQINIAELGFKKQLMCKDVTAKLFEIDLSVYRKTLDMYQVNVGNKKRENK
jgi:hypothetical protein